MFYLLRYLGVLLELHRSNSMPESGETPVNGPKSAKKHLHTSSVHEQSYLFLFRLEPRVRACVATSAPDNGGNISPSNDSSCVMKYIFGEMSHFLPLTKLNAVFDRQPCDIIRYAIVNVTLRLIPARQCTKTALLFVRASSKKCIKK